MPEGLGLRGFGQVEEVVWKQMVEERNAPDARAVQQGQGGGLCGGVVQVAEGEDEESHLDVGGVRVTLEEVVAYLGLDLGCKAVVLWHVAHVNCRRHGGGKPAKQRDRVS